MEFLTRKNFTAALATDRESSESFLFSRRWNFESRKYFLRFPTNKNGLVKGRTRLDVKACPYVGECISGKTFPVAFNASR